MPPMFRLTLIGAAGWALATVGLRLLPVWPQPALAAGLVVLILLAALIAFVGWLVRGLPRQDRPAGAIAVALPGMIGDAFASAHFAQMFPNAAPSLGGWFAGLMLVGYAAILAGGLVASRRD